MEFLGVNLDIKNLPELDPEFIPLHRFNEAFLRGAEKPVGIALERAGGAYTARRRCTPPTAITSTAL